MIVNKSTAQHDKVRIDVTLTAKEVQDSIREALRHDVSGQGADNALQVSDVLDGRINYADKQVQNYLKHLLVSPITKEVLDYQEPSPVTRPIIVAKEDIAPDEDFAFTISYMSMPQFSLTSYGPVAITVPDISVSDKELTDALDGLLKEGAELVCEADGTPVTADKTVEVSIDARYEDGSPYFGLMAAKRQCRIGEGFLPPEFDEALLGMKVGETRGFMVELPVGSFVEEDAAKTTPVKMTVTVDKVMAERPPVISDAWVRENVPGFTSAETLKAYVRNAIHAQKEEELEAIKMRMAVDALTQRLDGSISDDFFEAQYKESCLALDEALDGQNMTREQFYQQQGTDEQHFRMMSMMEIRDRFSQVFALDAFARELGLEANDEDIEEYLAELAQQDEHEAAKVREVSYKTSLKEAVCRSRAMKKLLEEAVC